MKKFKGKIASKFTASFLCLALLLSTLTISVSAQAYDPAKDFESLGLKFTTEKPEVGFYINAAEKFTLEYVPDLMFGTNSGEWSAMDLLRGKYTGADYINDIPSDYFDNYIKVFEKALIDKKGTPHVVKYTEYSRLMLALSSLGYDVHNAAPHYRMGSYSGTVVPEGTEGAIEYSYDIPLRYSVSNSTLYRQGINGPIWVLIAMNTGNYKFYTKSQLESGISGEDATIKHKLDSFGIKKLEDEGKTVNDTTGYVSPKGISTEGKQIDYILSREITQTNGTKGGWALTGDYPDPDITGMALQALAPYYLDEDRYNEVKANAYYDSSYSLPYTFTEFKEYIERAIYVMSNQQLDNGGFKSWGTTNSESVSQIVVALTELNIDPLAKNIHLKTIDKDCNFIKSGMEQDGVTTTNMIDNIITFWAEGSGSVPQSAGFKHVTEGYDGGGGSGTGVNGMATDQAIYGLISYDRFKKGEKPLYDMTDMTGGQYKTMTTKNLTVTYDMNGHGDSTNSTFTPYEVITVPTSNDDGDYNFAGYNTKKDGTGIALNKDDKLSMPSSDVTLYAQWTLKPEISGPINDTISKIDAIGTVTLDSEASIQAARDAYDTVTEKYKSMVTNYEVLTTAESTLATLKANKALVDSVESKINAIGNVTLESGSLINEARSAYDGLSENIKPAISNYDILTTAESTLATLKANKVSVDDVKSKIDKIGNVTLESGSLINEARSAYNALSDENKTSVSNYSVLTSAEEKLAILKTPKEEKNEKTGVIVMIDPTVVPAGTTIDVNEIKADDTSFATIEKSVESIGNKFVAYDIDLYSNNVSIEPNGELLVKLPLPTTFSPNKVAVVRILDDGTTKQYPCTVKDGIVEFLADHFSNYAIVEKSETPANNGSNKNDNTDNSKNTVTDVNTTPSIPTTEKKVENPKTGDSNKETNGILLSLVAMLVSSSFVFKFKKSKIK